MTKDNSIKLPDCNVQTLCPGAHTGGKGQNRARDF